MRTVPVALRACYCCWRCMGNGSIELMYSFPPCLHLLVNQHALPQLFHLPAAMHPPVRSPGGSSGRPAVAAPPAPPRSSRRSAARHLKGCPQQRRQQQRQRRWSRRCIAGRAAHLAAERTGGQPSCQRIFHPGWLEVRPGAGKRCTEWAVQVWFMAAVAAAAVSCDGP